MCLTDRWSDCENRLSPSLNPTTLQHLHDLVASCTRLTSLKLAGCNLQQFSMPSLPNLTELHMNRCDLACFTGIDQLVSLKSLDLGGSTGGDIILPACLQDLQADCLCEGSTILQSVANLRDIRSIRAEAAESEADWSAVFGERARQSESWPTACAKLECFRSFMGAIDDDVFAGLVKCTKLKVSHTHSSLCSLFFRVDCAKGRHCYGSISILLATLIAFG